MSTMRTPKRKLASGTRSRRSSTAGGSRRSSTASVGNSAPSSRRTSSADAAGGAKADNSSAARRKRSRRGSDKWNVKADDPDAVKHEQAGNVATTQPPLSKSALKRKYSRPMLATINVQKESKALLELPVGEWDKIVECLERIRAVANGEPEALQGSEELVFNALSHCVPNARSAIPRHALNTLQIVLSNTGSALASNADLKPATEKLVLLLLKTSATHDKKFIKAAATRCITEATSAAKGSQAFASHFAAPAVLSHRSRLIIAAGISGFQRCIEACPATDLAAWDPAEIAACLHRVMTAGASNARSSSKVVGRALIAAFGEEGVEDIKQRVSGLRGVTPADVAAVFKAQRMSARKKARRPRPWARSRQ